MVNIKMEFWYCVITSCLLILTTEASTLHFEPSLRNVQSSSITFTPFEYDPTSTDEPEPPSSIHPNNMSFRRVVEITTNNERGTPINKIENVFRNIFEINSESDDPNFCYFGEVFQKNQQYHAFEITPRGSVHISIGFGYAWNNVKLKGRTGEFVVNSRSNVLLSKNDEDSNIVVEIQSGSVTEVLTSPKNRLYRPVVCLKGNVLITVTVYNGMKMASIPSATAVDLPNAEKKLKPLTTAQWGSWWRKSVLLQDSRSLIGFGLIEIHTLTSTTPETYIFTGYFFDGRKWWMSPSLVDKKNNWGNGEIYSEVTVSTTSIPFISLSVWVQGRNGHSMKVDTRDQKWESKIFAIYDTSARSYQDPTASVRLRPGWVTEITKHHCSGGWTCSRNTECNWPFSDRQKLLPGVCITKTCKYMIEARKRTGVYKPDGVRTIGDETTMRLIAPSDVGVEKKGIAMIKALLDRAEDFEDIEPTGDYEFGGLVDPPSGESGPQKRYFNDVDIYLDVEKPVCEEKTFFVPIKSSAGTTVGFGRYINIFDYIRCTSHYAVIENLVTNALDPQKKNVLEEYAKSQYQRVDPNRALDDFESHSSYLPEWPLWPRALPKDLTRNLYYNNDNPDAGHYYSPPKAAFYDHDYNSADTRLYIGLASCFYDCVAYYYINGDPVFHVTTFVRERKGNSADKKYYTEVHPLMWYSGLYSDNIDFAERDVGMTLYDDYNIPSWFVNQNGDDPDMFEASYISLPAFHTQGDHPPNPYLTHYLATRVVESFSEV